MPGFFDAVKNFKPNSTNKKHFVTIGNKEVEVSLQKKLEINRHGPEKYELIETKEGLSVKLKKVILGKFEQTELVKAEKGYKLYKKNPFYVESIGDNGYTWKIKQKS